MALTVGVATVLDSREVIVVVTGQRKALALSKAIGEFSMRLGDRENLLIILDFRGGYQPLGTYRCCFISSYNLTGLTIQ